MRGKILGAMIAYGLAGAMAGSAQAIPKLQLYIEGATYDVGTETWTLTPGGSSGGDPFRVWAIGNVAGPGGMGTISNVRLSVAYDSAITPTITLDGSTTLNFGGYTDPSEPADVVVSQTVTDGSAPVIGGGKSVSPHGIFGTGTNWQEFALGDFSLTDSPMEDFIDAFPLAPTDLTGQINVYEVSIAGGTGKSFHFDLYGLLDGEPKFAPYSHDVEIVPAPGAALLAMIGLGMSAQLRRRRSA